MAHSFRNLCCHLLTNKARSKYFLLYSSARVNSHSRGNSLSTESKISGKSRINNDSNAKFDAKFVALPTNAVELDGKRIPTNCKMSNQNIPNDA